MKSNSFTSMFFGCMAVGAAFAACSGETITFPDNTGGGGSGSTTTSSSSDGTTISVASSISATSSSTTSSVSGGGGGDICADACAHAEECNAPVCNFIPHDCSDARAECAAGCLLDASCAQIASLLTASMDQVLLTCLTGCQQGGSGGGGAGGAPPNGTDCGICVLQDRCLPNCGADVPCRDWLSCARACLQDDPQPTCFRTCDTNFPAASASYGDAYTCTCTSCSDECGAVIDPCNARHAEPRGM